MQSFVKMNTSRNVEISLLLTDVVYSCLSHEFEMWQICLLTQFAKIKFLRKFLNLQYMPKLKHAPIGFYFFCFDDRT